MTEHKHHIQFEKLHLPGEEPDSEIRSAFARHEQLDLQLGLDWVSNLASTALESRDKAVIFIARHAPDDFVALPLKIDTQTGQATSLSTFYSSIYSPIIQSPSPEPLLQALLQHLRRSEQITSIIFSPLAADSPVYPILRNTLSHSGWRGVHTFFCFGNWVHSLDGETFQSYLAARSSRLRSTVKRRTRQFLEGKRGELALVTGGNNLADAIGQFVSIYNHSWKRPEPYPQFIPRLLQLAARRGWLRLGIAYYDGAAVASQIWFVWQDTAYIFKLAYHEDFKQLSPGTVLTAFMLEHAIDQDRVRKIDYLSGDDAYKRDWMTQRHERHGIAAYNARSLRGSAMFLGHTIKKVLKSLSLARTG